MNNIIKQKIKNGEGVLKLKKRGIVSAKLYDEKTDPKKNPVDWKDWQTDPIILKPTKQNYEIELKDGLIKEKMTKEELNNPDNYNLGLSREMK